MMMLLHSHHCCSNSATDTRAIVMITYLEVGYGAVVLLVISQNYSHTLEFPV